MSPSSTLLPRGSKVMLIRYSSSPAGIRCVKVCKSLSWRLKLRNGRLANHGRPKSWELPACISRSASMSSSKGQRPQRWCCCRVRWHQKPWQTMAWRRWLRTSLWSEFQMFQSTIFSQRLPGPTTHIRIWQCNLRSLMNGWLIELLCQGTLSYHWATLSKIALFQSLIIYLHEIFHWTGTSSGIQTPATLIWEGMKTKISEAFSKMRLRIPSSSKKDSTVVTPSRSKSKNWRSTQSFNLNSWKSLKRQLWQHSRTSVEFMKIRQARPNTKQTNRPTSPLNSTQIWTNSLRALKHSKSWKSWSLHGTMTSWKTISLLSICFLMSIDGFLLQRPPSCMILYSTGSSINWCRRISSSFSFGLSNLAAKLYMQTSTASGSTPKRRLSLRLNLISILFCRTSRQLSFSSIWL